MIKLLMTVDCGSAREINFTQDEIMGMLVRWLKPERVPKKFKVITDTSDFFRVDYDDVVILGGLPYLIRNYEREGRFGIDDEPKFWVKRAIDLTDGSVKIIKMVFHERFAAKIGGMVFDCVRSPKKEARVLDLVRGHPNFMQGFSVRDSAGNIIRIIDHIAGKTMADYASGCGKSHEDYFYNYFPAIFDEYIELVEAINFIHEQGEKHGDIRRDHIIKDNRSGKCRWIDFDFNYWHKENMFGYDLFGLGNILTYLSCRGELTVQQLAKDDPKSLNSLTPEDMNIIFNNRLVNIKKVYPYIPDSLNLILLHFSQGADTFYDNTVQFSTDLKECRDNIGLKNKLKEAASENGTN